MHSNINPNSVWRFWLLVIAYLTVMRIVLWAFSFLPN